MTPGTAMDSLIARKVWKALVVYEPSINESYLVGEVNREKVPLPSYSTNVEDAYRVVEYFQRKGYALKVNSVPEEGCYYATFLKDDGRTYRFCRSETMPMAICLAALSVLDGTNVVA